MWPGAHSRCMLSPFVSQTHVMAGVVILLARIALPPHGCDANVSIILHRRLVGHTGGVEHGLRAGEVMVFGERRGILVESLLAICRCSVRCVRKIQEPRLFALLLFLCVGWIHCPWFFVSPSLTTFQILHTVHPMVPLLPLELDPFFCFCDPDRVAPKARKQ